MLIEPDAAKQYQAAHAITPRPILDPASTPHPSPTQFGLGVISPLIPQVLQDNAAKDHAFIGTAEVNASTAKMRLVQIAGEIIGVLASDSKAIVIVRWRYLPIL